ncbi:hypothetical protein [Candidatus Nesciobacter abundans]|nr:hypothetical protein [Candidatus Nesciobacter abundans]
MNFTKENLSNHKKRQWFGRFNLKNFIAFSATAVEYYDYILFMEMSFFTAVIFFPEKFNSLFYFFSMGYGVRLVGSFLMSVFKNKIEKLTGMKIMTFALFSVSFITFFICLIPPYKQVGIVSTYLFIICRIVQSFFYGTQIPSAISFVRSGKDTESLKGMEYRKDNSSSSSSEKAGLVISGASLGTLACSLVVFLLSKLFSKESIVSFYWKFPFLFGSILGSVILYFSKPRKVDSELSSEEDLENNSENGLDVDQENKSKYDKKSKSVFMIYKNLNVDDFLDFFFSVSMMLMPAVLIITYIYFANFFSTKCSYDFNVVSAYRLIGYISALFMNIFAYKIVKLLDNMRSLDILKIFVFIWVVFLILATKISFFLFCLLMFTQLSITYTMNHALQNMYKHNSHSLNTLSYNVSFFIASLSVSMMNSLVKVMLIPVIFSVFFYFGKSSIEKKNVSKHSI